MGLSVKYVMLKYDLLPINTMKADWELQMCLKTIVSIYSVPVLNGSIIVLTPSCLKVTLISVFWGKSKLE